MGEKSRRRGSREFTLEILHKYTEIRKDRMGANVHLYLNKRSKQADLSERRYKGTCFGEPLTRGERVPIGVDKRF